MMAKGTLVLTAASALIGWSIAQAPVASRNSCAAYRITTEEWNGRQVWWVYKQRLGWPFCSYRLDTPSLSNSLADAEKKVAQRKALAVTAAETTVKEIW